MRIQKIITSLINNVYGLWNTCIRMKLYGVTKQFSRNMKDNTDIM